MLNVVEDTFHQIWQDIFWVSAQWKMYKVLFLNAAHRDLLTSAAGGFFQAVKLAVQRDVMLSLCRLADPAKQGPHQNLSLRAMRALMQGHSDKEFLAELDRELARIEALAAPIRVWRDKNIAHTDVAAALGYHELEDVPPETVDAIIEKMGALFVRIQLAQHPGAYQDPIAKRSERTAQRLLDVLRLGVAAAPPWGEFGDD